MHGEERHAYRILVGKPEERDHYEDLYVSGRIIFKWISEKQGGVVWIGLIRRRIGTSGGLLLIR
jgi:hypothetical protein